VIRLGLLAVILAGGAAIGQTRATSAQVCRSASGAAGLTCLSIANLAPADTTRLPSGQYVQLPQYPSVEWVEWVICGEPQSGEACIDSGRRYVSPMICRASLQ
jgi:surface antigen